jgi:hypothetical protein
MERTKVIEAMLSDIASENVKNKRRRERAVEAQETTVTNNYAPSFVEPVSVASGSPAGAVSQTEVDISDYVPRNAVAILVSYEVKLTAGAASGTPITVNHQATSTSPTYRALEVGADDPDTVAAQSILPISNQRFWFSIVNSVATYDVELHGYFG